MSKNGYLRDDELTIVQGSGANAIRLSLGFAAVLRRMQADAAKDGVRITLVSSYHGAAGYRSRVTQLDMRVHPSLYSITPGIVPGLPSEHGTGNCMDIDQGLAWVKKNGARYGVRFPLAFDHNHAQWNGITLAGESGTPLVEQKPKRRIDMPYLIRVSSKDNSYTEAVLTDFVHTKVISAAEARNVMYCRPDLPDTDGFDAVVAQSNYDALKALPAFPTIASGGSGSAVDLSPVLTQITSEADRVISKIPTKLS